MEEVAQRQLSQLTSQFYAKHAGSFSATRQTAWTSWQRILKQVCAQTAVHSVLDIGCGNGRLADFLDQHLTDPFEFLGIDPEPQLLASASTGDGRTFMEGDINTAVTLGRAFDLVTMFGVLHHIPGASARQTLIRSAASLLNDNGILVVSFWQPRNLPNFQNKLWPTAPPELETLLEQNDYLLGWQNDFSSVRFCHHFDDSEIDEIVSDSGLITLDRFSGTGNDATNMYVLLGVRRD